MHRNSKSWWIPLLALLSILLLSGCDQLTALQSQPRYNPLDQSDFFADRRSARIPPAGTVPQTELAVDDPVVTGRDASGQPLTAIPVEVTNELIIRGQERFTIFCTPCHGADAQGTGRAVAFGMPQPPSLVDEAYQAVPVGDTFDVIDNGRGVMFPYGYRVKAPDRWAIIAYLKAMQLKGGPLAEELTPEELSQIGGQP